MGNSLLVATVPQQQMVRWPWMALAILTGVPMGLMVMDRALSMIPDDEAGRMAAVPYIGAALLVIFFHLFIWAECSERAEKVGARWRAALFSWATTHFGIVALALIWLGWIIEPYVPSSP